MTWGPCPSRAGLCVAADKSPKPSKWGSHPPEPAPPCQAASPLQDILCFLLQGHKPPLESPHPPDWSSESFSALFPLSQPLRVSKQDHANRSALLAVAWGLGVQELPLGG